MGTIMHDDINYGGGGGSGNSVTVENKGSASASTIAYQAITIDNTDYKIDGTVYMEQTLQVTANTDATFTFANSIITTDSAIDLWASVYGIAPKSVIVTSGSCVIVFNIPTTTDLTCRIYIRNNASAPIIETYLPYSTRSNIVCEAYADNFVIDANTWGKGVRKIQFSNGNPTLDTSERAVSLLANTNSTIGYVDLGSSATPFTAYVVMKAINPISSSVLLCSMDGTYTNSGLIFFGNSINIGSWNVQTDTGISSSNDYFVGAMKFVGANNGLGYIYGENFVTLAPSTCGRYITLGRVNPTSTGGITNSDLLIKYVGVVYEAEDNSIIQNNIENLYGAFVNSN